MRASVEETRQLMELVLLAKRMRNLIEDINDINDGEGGINYTIQQRMLAALADEPTIDRVAELIKHIK